MKKNKSIKLLKYCYGCSLCTCICPKHIIDLKLNYSGFYQPVIIDEKLCIQCGLCLKVCSFYNEVHKINIDTIHGFASWSKEEAVRKRASSGGTGFEISRSLLSKGYKVIAVRYNAEKQRAEHYVASSETELIAGMGSKYIQSYPVEAFKEIKKGGRFLITGTPCQIASMRRYVRMKRMEEDVVLMDFFCHGVPSKLVWDKYVAKLEPRIGKVTYASWRNKQTGWHDSWVMGLGGEQTGTPVDWHDSYNMLIREKTSYSRRRSEGDLFYKFFLSDVCFNKACYKDCKFKHLQSAADIRIGDLWGSKYAHDEKGVTGILVFTDKGKRVLSDCNIEKIPESIDVITEEQLKCPMKQPYYYRFLLGMLRLPLQLPLIYRTVQLLRIGTILKYKLHLK